MLIRKETEYAILGLISMAKQRDQYIDVKALARAEKIPEALLAKVFQKMVVTGILESRVGPTGGFKLNKNPSEISLLNIIKAIQEPEVIKCFSGSAPYCKKPVCTLKKTIIKIEKFIENYLANTSLFEIIAEEIQLNLGKSN